MKSITLSSDEWQGIIEALNLAINHSEDRLHMFSIRGDGHAVGKMNRQITRYQMIRSNILKETAPKEKKL